MTVKKVLMYSLIGFVIFAIIISGIIFYVTNIKFSQTNSNNNTIEQYEFSLDELYTNIKDSNRILKASISISYTDKNLLELLNKKQARITNDILEFFRSKSLEELSGKEGQQDARNNILTIVKEILNSENVSNIYFTEFIIQ